MAFLGAFKQKFSRLAGLLLIMLLCIAPLAWLNIAHPQQAQNISHIISQNILLLACFRWLLIIAFYVFWPTAITYISTRYNWSTEKITFWQKQRLKITAWLALFEFILCENILLTATHLIEGI